MKSPPDRPILRVVVATGIASVATQLVSIRELVSQFAGNEYVIALIIFIWLMIGGLGTRLAQAAAGRWIEPSPSRLGLLSLALVGLAPLQILAIRTLRDVVFVSGSSVGFYHTLAYSLVTLSPYALLVGFLLPFSLYVLRARVPDYPGTRLYLTDNLGDVLGGALFSFALVVLFGSLQSVALANLPLLLLAIPLLSGRRQAVLALAAVAGFLLLGLIAARPTLDQAPGRLVAHQESRYGRITVYEDQGQHTLFTDGKPYTSGHNAFLAEEMVHFPLAQIPEPKRVLLISAAGGVMQELAKYEHLTVDYVEIDPALTSLLFRFDILSRIPGLQVIHADGRAALQSSDAVYDAVILGLDEPETFKANRFFTRDFFALVKERLVPGGILSFSVEGFDNYLAEPRRQTISSLARTAEGLFDHVRLLPGQRIVFLCSDRPVRTDIPSLLEAKGIPTQSISWYYQGNVTPERIAQLQGLLHPVAPANTDLDPELMHLMFTQWFATYATSPWPFYLGLGLACCLYLWRITREELVLFTTGCQAMGCELLIIFTVQIVYGYVYTLIGLIVTLFLAGLFPGALLGERLRGQGKRLLAWSDCALMGLTGLYALGLWQWTDLPVWVYLSFGFAVALVCGFQFPVALELRGGDNPAVSRTFSADLIGAAAGTLVTSILLIPYAGLLWTAVALIGLKGLSLATVTLTR